LELLDAALDVLSQLMQWEHAPAIASQIYNAKADYVLALIANHPTLYKQVETWFKQAQSQDFKGMKIYNIDTAQLMRFGRIAFPATIGIMSLVLLVVIQRSIG
jgi:hypothetical protein